MNSIKNRTFAQTNIITLAITVAIIFTVASCKKEEAPTEKALITQSFIGDVAVISGGAETLPEIGKGIDERSIIKTGKASLIDLQYRGSGTIRINENSVVNASKLTTDSMLELKKGKIFVVLSKLKKNEQFKVQTSTTVAAIRGTSFRVSADEKKSRIDVLSGKIKVNPVKEGKIIEEIEQTVEANNAVEVKEDDVDEIIEENRGIEVAVIRPETISEIKNEVKNITLDSKISDTLEEEIKEVGIESVVIDMESTSKLQKSKSLLDKEREKEKKKQEELERLKREQEKIEKQKREEDARAKKRKAMLLKKKAEEKARREAERIAREKREQEERERRAREEAERREKKKIEERVKNIPTL